MGEQILTAGEATPCATPADCCWAGEVDLLQRLILSLVGADRAIHGFGAIGCGMWYRVRSRA